MDLFSVLGTQVGSGREQVTGKYLGGRCNLECKVQSRFFTSFCLVGRLGEEGEGYKVDGRTRWGRWAEHVGEWQGGTQMLIPGCCLWLTARRLLVFTRRIHREVLLQTQGHWVPCWWTTEPGLRWHKKIPRSVQLIRDRVVGLSPVYLLVSQCSSRELIQRFLNTPSICQPGTGSAGGRLGSSCHSGAARMVDWPASRVLGNSSKSLGGPRWADQHDINLSVSHVCSSWVCRVATSPRYLKVIRGSPVGRGSMRIRFPHLFFCLFFVFLFWFSVFLM